MGLAQVGRQDFALDPAAVQVRADAMRNTIRGLLDDVKANPGRYKACGTGKAGKELYIRSNWDFVPFFGRPF